MTRNASRSTASLDASMANFGLISGIYPTGIYHLGAYFIFFQKCFSLLWMSCGSGNLPISSLRYSLKLVQFALKKLTYVLFVSLTLTAFFLIEMRIGMWSELRAGCVVHSVHKSNDGLAIKMSGELLTVGVILVGKSSFNTPQLDSSIWSAKFVPR